MNNHGLTAVVSFRGQGRTLFGTLFRTMRGLLISAKQVKILTLWK